MTTDTRKITAARIEESWGRATMYVTLDDDSEWAALSWYVDELSFTTDEAIGMTIAELRRLRHKRDVAYLRSD